MSLTVKGCLPDGTREPLPESVIFGKSAGMQLIRRNLQKLTASNISILIQGESGTGKQSFALAIHRGCGESDRNFIKFTCPTLPDSPGKFSDLTGRITLYLDGIAELDMEQQAKLLQMLQEGLNPCDADSGRFRLICATNRDLEDEVEIGRFRRDLFFRINAFRISLPSLRQRTEDIPDLVSYLLKLHCDKNGAPRQPISGELMELMRRYHWPGNIRELENLVRRYVILGSEQVIGSELLAKVPAEFTREQFSGGSISLKKLSRQAARDVERRVILNALETSGWNRKLAARSLNISYRALLYKIKQGGMPPKRTLSSRVSPAVSLND